MAAVTGGRDRGIEESSRDGGEVADARGVTGPASSAAAPAFVPNETKLHATRSPRHTIRRGSLIDSLLGETAPLVLLSAAAGSGKTTTVRQWLGADERASAWLQLDAGDNDPITLLQYLARALLRLSPLDPAVLTWLGLPEPPVGKAIVPALVRAASAAPPFILVLDDTHALRDPRCWQLLGVLVDAAPVGAAIVMSGRSDPPLPLGRLRSGEALREYRAPELWFDRVETTSLLALHGVEADEEVVDALLEATEGWPAGIYLAVLAWKAGDGARRVVPSGDRREIADYLTSEALADQPPDVVEFLTRTSIVSRLSPELAVVLTGREDSGRLLETLERENLFLTPLDDHREWYRYHHLFSELLEVELRRREPHLAEDLHRRAAVWLADRDHVDEALHHWLQAGEEEEAGDLVASRWLSRYLTGRVWSARRWLYSFTGDQIRQQPNLRMAASWLLAFTGESVTARGLLAGLEPSALSGPAPDFAASSASSLAMIRALLASAGPEQMRDDARLAVRLEDEGGRQPSYGLACLLLGAAESLCGDDAASVGPFRQAVLASATLRNGIELAALGDLSLLAGDDGRWDEARAYTEEAARLAAAYDLGADHLPSVPARLARDRLCAREHDDDAVADLKELLGQLDRDFCPWVAVRVALLLTEAFIDRDEELAARLQLDEAAAIVGRWAPAPGLTRRIEALHAKLRGRSSTEPLSPAEARVLELLPTNLTAAEIADHLSVSPNTVGTHIKALHRKLGAGRRSEVVERAVELGLLPASPQR